MLKWLDIKRFATQGNPEPDHRVIKTEEEWRNELSPEAYYVLREQGTERAFSSEMCSVFEPGLYECAGCHTLLFDSNEKFESGSGWPSFVQPYRPNAVAYHKDESHGMVRIEATCNTCGGHLGHVFPDGPDPSGLRYCINAAAMVKAARVEDKATFGGGCFWCTEAIFQNVEGVIRIESGYSAGQVRNPTYREVCTGTTGHAEVVQITYNPAKISYSDLLRLHLLSHDPTTLNQQGADRGTQYRSIILTHNDQQASEAKAVIEEMQPTFDQKIVTEVAEFDAFYKAEIEHQNYFNDHPDAGYCQVVIAPKVQKFKEAFKERLKH
jgi:peptide methionine sulfoxide reductase msrA/msrB